MLPKEDKHEEDKLGEDNPGDEARRIDLLQQLIVLKLQANHADWPQSSACKDMVIDCTNLAALQEINDLLAECEVCSDPIDLDVCRREIATFIPPVIVVSYSRGINKSHGQAKKKRSRAW